MCPLCITAAAWAAMAGGSSAGGLATFVAVKRRVKPHSATSLFHGASRRSARKPQIDEVKHEIRHNHRQTSDRDTR